MAIFAMSANSAKRRSRRTSPTEKAARRPPQPKASAARTLERAFQTFADAADSLQKAYAQLQGDVLRLRFELERSNRDLASSVEENARMRRYLGRILESLPSGVVVVDRDGQVKMANPTARFFAIDGSRTPGGGRERTGSAAGNC